MTKLSLHHRMPAEW